MKTSTEIMSAAKIVGEEKAIEYIAKAGFDAWDFSMFPMARYDRVAKCLKESTHPLSGKDYLAFAKKLKQIGLDHGIVCNQSHAPFPVYFAEIRSFMKRAIECSAEAGAKICIIHPDNFASAEKNAEMYQELLPFAKECGVKIAAENMWQWDKELDQATFSACATPESFCEHIDLVNDENLVACLDIGHAQMRGLNTSAVELIHALGHRLKALHIHDNDCWHDSHQIPFSMQIDFPPIVKALKEIGYDGDFTLECDNYLKNYTPETVFDGIKNLASAARRLADLYEAL